MYYFMQCQWLCRSKMHKERDHLYLEWNDYNINCKQTKSMTPCITVVLNRSLFFIHAMFQKYRYKTEISKSVIISIFIFLNVIHAWFYLLLSQKKSCAKVFEILKFKNVFFPLFCLAASCPESFEHGNGTTRACYRVFSGSVPRNHSEAETYCQKLHPAAHLATVDTDDKKTFIAGMLQDVPRKWNKYMCTL